MSLDSFSLFYPKQMKIPPVLKDEDASAPLPNYALLINPFYPKDPYASFGKHVLTPSLALLSIAGATPSHWKVRYWDENLLQGSPPVDPFPAVVGVTVHLTFARRAFELADWHRERGAKVVLGGLHVQSCPEECEPHADALAIGEGVQLWPEILRDIEDGRLKKRYEGSYSAPYREELLPRRDVLHRGDFLTTASLIAARGCHNRCDFCYLSTRNFHQPFQQRDIEQVVSEFASLNEPYGVFTDNNLGSKPEYLRELCRQLRPLQKIWSAAVSVDAADDPSLIREMALAGCTGVFIGFESLNCENLAAAHKKSPRPDDFARRVRLFHEAGIQVNGSFVFGFDHDDPDVFARTVDWIEKNRLECATFHILTPYPGTPLFRRLESEGRLLHRNWDLYDTSHCVFLPKRLSPDQLEEGYRWCYKRLFSHRSIWRRRPSQLADAPGYMAMSYLYKRSNRLWTFLIRHRLTHAVWRPLIQAARWRHCRFRRYFEQSQIIPEGRRSDYKRRVST
ncbi:MAG: B12-binding domain-containing radical SAM protein [Candidatus Omnitrophica bacterium]|nr:B12-binding domain-containing radical SAM protein [Candidatus Omnitrophota bacterium]